MKTIYLVTKHRVVNRFSGNTFISHHTAFEIHGVYETINEAKTEAKVKDNKSAKYIYKVKKIVFKASEA
jgi:hypothetical protein